jgi:hypothetical protein
MLEIMDLEMVVTYLLEAIMVCSWYYTYCY